MEDKVLIRRSSAGLQAQLIAIGVATIVLVLLSNWLLGKLLPNSEHLGLIKLIVWVLFVIAWVVGSSKLWFEWQIKRYEIAPDALIIHSKAGKWGKSQTVYRYESMISIRTSQNFLGRRFDYGDVFITIPKLDKEIVLNDIENPFEQLAEVQKRIGERSGGPHALVN